MRKSWAWVGCTDKRSRNPDTPRRNAATAELRKKSGFVMSAPESDAPSFSPAGVAGTSTAKKKAPTAMATVKTASEPVKTVSRCCRARASRSTAASMRVSVPTSSVLVADFSRTRRACRAASHCTCTPDALEGRDRSRQLCSLILALLLLSRMPVLPCSDGNTVDRLQGAAEGQRGHGRRMKPLCLGGAITRWLLASPRMG
mmetsp:Transcript_10533/g.31365  ORF Transcript_10533/g.31365 Transcript_10533/m.31365 type:complete len:201 (+) Transcript_10533:1347-1949(+)